MCSGKAPQSPAELFSPCQAPMKATAFQLLLGCGFPAAQPGGWMFSPLLGACTDSCVRQNPDCRAWSIKLPIRLLQNPAKQLPWRHVRPRPGHPGWRGEQEGRPGTFQTHPNVSSHTSGRTEWEKERSQRPPHCVEEGEVEGDRNPVSSSPHRPGIHPQSVQDFPTFVQPPRRRVSHIFDFLAYKNHIFVPNMQRFGEHMIILWPPTPAPGHLE